MELSKIQEGVCKELLLKGKKYYEVADYTKIPYDEIIKKDISDWRIRINHKNKWTNEKDSIAQEMLKNGFHYIDIAKRLDISTKSIQHRNSNTWKLELKEERKFKESLRTPELENKICELFNLGLTLGLINSEIDYVFSTEKSISDILKRKGYDPKKKSQQVHWDNHYFDFINSEERAYFLGLLFTDGWITKRDETRYDIGICLEDTDTYMINNFKKALRSDRSIVRKQFTKKDGTIGHYSQLVLTDNHLAFTLMKYGLTERKSKTMSVNLNEIPKKHINHFMRGMIDGNGSVTIGSNNNLIIKMIGTKDIIDFFNYYLWSNDFAPFKTPKLHKRISFPFFEISYADIKDVSKLYNFFMNDGSVFLERKWSTAKKWLKENKLM